jgi:hypothetical protein
MWYYHAISPVHILLTQLTMKLSSLTLCVKILHQ